jgi:hypothetical protein
MFKFIGKITRLGCDTVVSGLEAIIEIPGDIIDGYQEGFSAPKLPKEEEKKVREVIAKKRTAAVTKTKATRTKKTAVNVKAEEEEEEARTV